jgi:hypothetical protein
MPTATSSTAPEQPPRRRAAVLIGYNLPFLLWSGYAAWRVHAPGDSLSCPVHALLGWCPSCGLTGDYAAILSGARPGHWLIWVVLAGFIANAVASLRKAHRLGGAAAAQPSPGQRTPA